MKKNFNVPLLDSFGLQATDDRSGRPLTVADVAVTALTEHCPGDENLTPVEKIGLHSLAIRIGESTKPGAPDGGAREFTKLELVTIKNRASKNVRILSFGRLCEIVDSDETKPGE